jgi:hypothetical protein
MNCIAKFFCKKPPPPEQLDLRIRNPVNLDELPNTLLELRAVEGAILDILVSLHYQIDSLNETIKNTMDRPSTENFRQLLGKRYMLTEKKKLFGKRLENVQEKIHELQ